MKFRYAASRMALILALGTALPSSSYAQGVECDNIEFDLQTKSMDFGDGINAASAALMSDDEATQKTACASAQSEIDKATAIKKAATSNAKCRAKLRDIATNADFYIGEGRKMAALTCKGNTTKARR